MLRLWPVPDDPESSEVFQGESHLSSHDNSSSSQDPSFSELKRWEWGGFECLLPHSRVTSDLPALRSHCRQPLASLPFCHCFRPSATARWLNSPSPAPFTTSLCLQHHYPRLNFKDPTFFPSREPLALPLPTQQSFYLSKPPNSVTSPRSRYPLPSSCPQCLLYQLRIKPIP